MSFLSTLAVTASAAALISPDLTRTYAKSAPTPAVALIGGLLCGVGTTLSNGCTSGHGVCGLGRLSVRSLYAVASFFSVGLATASLTHGLHSDQSDSPLGPVSPLGLTITLLLVSSTATVTLLTHNSRPTKVLAAVSPAAVAGTLFASGLLISGMSNPLVVRNFLNLSDFPQLWNATLAFVMAGASTVSFLGYRYKAHRAKTSPTPLLCATDEPCECSFSSIPGAGKPDLKLVGGAALFGIGWGLTGVCPGPALVCGALGVPSILYCYIPALFVGKGITAYLTKKPTIPVEIDLDALADYTDPAANEFLVSGTEDLPYFGKVNGWLKLIPEESYSFADPATVPFLDADKKCNSVMVSVEADSLTSPLVDSLIAALDALPRPALISCKSGARATAVARLYAARKLNATSEVVLRAAIAKKEPWTNNEKLVQWIKDNLPKERAEKTGLIFRQLFDKESSTYSYLLGDAATKIGLIIDPVDTLADRDVRIATELGLTLSYGLNTHAHADHITGTAVLRTKLKGLGNSDFKSVISESSGAKADKMVGDCERIYFGSRYLEVRFTPGHTAGCACFVLDDESMVFTGDALLIRGCGRTDFQGGSASTLFKSVRENLFVLPDECVVYPAHNYIGVQCSSIGEEKEHNPRLKEGIGEAQFIQIMLDLKLNAPKMLDVAVPKNLNCGV